MKIRFLIDENLSPKLKKAVLHLNPDIDIAILKVKRGVGANETDI